MKNQTVINKFNNENFNKFLDLEFYDEGKLFIEGKNKIVMLIGLYDFIDHIREINKYGIK